MSPASSDNLQLLRQFIGRSQLAVIREGIMGEEGQFFADKLSEIYGIIAGMPKTYETQDMPNPLAYLHYFYGNCDWYIFERDQEAEQLQAFGWANLGDDQNAELGYISIKEIIDFGGELDLFFKPISLAQIQAKGAA
jgi:hypothetical protein